MRTVAIVAVRGGSKGIPNKGVALLRNRPLIDWTLMPLREVPEIESVWVLSDSEAILARAFHFGCNQIIEPGVFAKDDSRIEDAWTYALGHIECITGPVDLVVAPQITSPLRHICDFSEAIKLFEENEYDSLFSASPAKDLCLWEMEGDTPTPEMPECTAENRKRQMFTNRIIENGSFYLFKPWVLRETERRFGGKLGVYMMPYWKLFEIDEPEDLRLCDVIMQAYLP